MDIIFIGEFAASKFSSTLQVRPDEGVLNIVIMQKYLEFISIAASTCMLSAAVLPSAQLGIAIQQPCTCKLPC